MADPNNALIILATGAHASPLGVTTGFAFEETIEVVKIQGEGTLGPSAVCAFRKDLTCLVDFLIKGVIAPLTKNSLIFSSKDNLGNTITDTLANMKALGYAKTMHKDNPPGSYRQLFTVEDAMSSDPVS